MLTYDGVDRGRWRAEPRALCGGLPHRSWAVRDSHDARDWHLYEEATAFPWNATLLEFDWGAPLEEAQEGPVEGVFSRRFEHGEAQSSLIKFA